MNEAMNTGFSRRYFHRFLNALFYLHESVVSRKNEGTEVPDVFPRRCKPVQRQFDSDWKKTEEGKARWGCLEGGRDDKRKNDYTNKELMRKEEEWLNERVIEWTVEW